MSNNGNWIGGVVILAGFVGILVAGTTCAPGPDKATATNPAGERVSLVVCCGWPFKGCTVRTP